MYLILVVVLAVVTALTLSTLVITLWKVLTTQSRVQERVLSKALALVASKDAVAFQAIQAMEQAPSTSSIDTEATEGTDDLDVDEQQFVADLAAAAPEFFSDVFRGDPAD